MNIKNIFSLIGIFILALVLTVCGPNAKLGKKVVIKTPLMLTWGLSEYEGNENNDFDDIIRIKLGKQKTEVFLNNFYPYILLRSMLGNQLDFPKNIDISVAIPTINYLDFVKFKINLKTS